MDVMLNSHKILKFFTSSASYEDYLGRAFAILYTDYLGVVQTESVCDLIRRLSRCCLDREHP